jgi:predicted nuclease of restriction endonuclease-like (RecB) superfamily
MEKLKQFVSEMLPSEEYKRKLEHIDEDENEKLKQPVSEFPSAFACVPWGHHVRIVQHSETIEEALFYVGYTIKEGISRDTLERVMKDDIYNKRGKAPNNFPKHLTPQLAGLAQQVVKENYDFGFATVSHETYDESELENALHENITALLLELGNGFAFLGKQRVS